ncbi:MAG: PilT/PilU family type 4a pilus ATPase [Candidatus Moranbacteria bacterium]|nr:PilT/PilU family type 4a pilus ATPase [Candidatus Moranbacteria bacterium]MDD3965205.1 PilT/PilU family type 4a pilus ATPase [Candidatus Moranbacteria bacterium]
MYTSLQTSPVNTQTLDQAVDTLLSRIEKSEEETPTLQIFDQTAFEAVLLLAQQENASDIHFSGNNRIAIRVNGSLVFLNYDTIDPKIAEEIILSLISDTAVRDQFLLEKEHDFCFTHKNGVSYRCNAYYKNGYPSISMRCISGNVPSLDQIGAPQKIKSLIQKKQGLIFICGPTGQGKTTTMAAMINEMNKTRSEHILTLEDPIEYVFESEKCMISQRELHTDTLSFDKSLRAAMRQDPDIIVIGEVRDRETAEAVFKLVATGHLVISTVHSTNTAQTLYRIVRMFTPGERDLVLSQMADSLLGILNQRLIPTIDGNRTAIFELLLANWASRNAIRNGDIAQLENTIASSADEGMLTFEQSLSALIREGKVNYSDIASSLEFEPHTHVSL